MLEALWQGELVAALDAVTEDVDLRKHVPETNRQRSHGPIHVIAVRRLLHFSRRYLKRW
jgi:hypothetical protein